MMRRAFERVVVLVIVLELELSCTAIDVVLDIMYYQKNAKKLTRSTAKTGADSIDEFFDEVIRPGFNAVVQLP